MLELLLSLLSEALLLKYITFRLLYLVPYIAAFLFVLLHLKLQLQVGQKWSLTECAGNVLEQTIIIFSPVLRWRIKCLSKMSDEVEAVPIY
ncbi:hypothetical protein [Macrococcus epidermidis]|uniref:hypothetical protein n=1 Tax=Macrococcus epidermidis TaxID=1902580 RepID=UPI0010EBF58B|nr:hypothetical protein [Macrococcus epidermidis]MCG7420941.1 hypothetical protein [Macrococcus epidermidis]TDM47271.1 hypothetical protein ETI06_10095 [Macrococcus goetzii]UTH15841.1 hypothetical protein KFV12_11215 [Macrococcus epidermidis]